MTEKALKLRREWSLNRTNARNCINILYRLKVITPDERLELKSRIPSEGSAIQ